MHEDIYEPCEFCGEHRPGWSTLTVDPLDEGSRLYWICNPCWEKREADRIALNEILADTNAQVPDA